MSNITGSTESASGLHNLDNAVPWYSTYEYKALQPSTGERTVCIVDKPSTCFYPARYENKKSELDSGLLSPVRLVCVPGRWAF